MIGLRTGCACRGDAVAAVACLRRLTTLLSAISCWVLDGDAVGSVVASRCGCVAWLHVCYLSG